MLSVVFEWLTTECSLNLKLNDMQQSDHWISNSFLSLMQVRQSVSVISSLKCCLRASIDSRVTIETIFDWSSKWRPYYTEPSFEILTATLPVLALAACTGFLLASIDKTLPSLRLSRSGIQSGVPGLRTPSITLRPITIGFVRLKQASGTISQIAGKTAVTPSPDLRLRLHSSTYSVKESNRW